MKTLIKIIIMAAVFYSSAYSLGKLSINTDNSPNWWIAPTDNSQNFAVPNNVSVKINSDTSLDVGDYLGAFYDSSGTAACAGYNTWNGGGQSMNVTVWGDDNRSVNKRGLLSGEAIKWKVFRQKDSKVYDVEVTVVGGSAVYTPETQSVIGAIFLKLGDVLPPWHFRNSGISHTIALPLNVTPAITGKKITAGDYVGVFYDSSGTLACAGYSVFKTGQANAITAWGDDEGTSVKEGMGIGEVFKWKIWRALDSVEYTAKAYYKAGEPNDSLFVSNGLSVLDSLNSTSSENPGNDSLVTLTCDFSFGDGDITKSINYRMIGLPCDGAVDSTAISLDNSVFYGRVPNSDWIAFLDDGTGNYIPYSQSDRDKFVFTPGKAFWVLSKYSFIINQLKAKPVVPSSDGIYKIPLVKGWNMISNPFNGNIDWSSLASKNNYLTDPIWDYNETGTYVVPGGFLPYRGYYFYNRKGLDSLRIPKPVIKEGKLNLSASGGSLKNPLTIGLKFNGSVVSQAYISINPEADNNLDDMDQFTPPSNFESSKIYLFNGELNADYKNLYIEARPAIGEGQAFDVRVKHTETGAYAVIFSGLENYGSYELFLINKRSLRFFNLRDNPLVPLSSAGADEFILAIGSKNFLQGLQTEMHKFDFALSQNYPNPFNPSTTISWNLAVDSRVSLKIFDLLGRELVTLVNETQKEGSHNKEFNIDKLKMSSGVYFYQLKASALDGSKEFTQIKKMVILK